MDGIYRKPTIKQENELPKQRDLPSALKPAKKEEIYITKDDLERMGQRTGKIRSRPLRINYKKIAFIFLGLLLFAVFFGGVFLIWKTYAISKKMNSNENASSQTFSKEVRSIIAPIATENGNPLKGQAEGRINILLLGAAGENKPGGNLTDTIMIMSIDTKNMKVALLSLPRDFYANIPASTSLDDRRAAGGPGSQSFVKINSLYKIGLNENRSADLIRQATEKITGLTLDYYVALDFDGFKKIIEDIGGINVMVERDLYDTRYPGPNYSYETFSITKGFHNLDGNTALKYVRERHSDPLGDFGRAQRQQQVIQAVKSKIFSARTFLNVVTLNNILDTLGDNIRTDISFDEVGKLIELSKKLDTQNITNIVVDAWKPESLLKVSHVQIGNVAAFILVPRVGNYSEIQDLAQNIFNQDEIRRRRTAMLEEDAAIEIINQSGSPQLGRKIQTLLTDKLGFKKVRLIQNSSDAQSSQTTISDNTSGQDLFTLDELVKKLPATLAEKQHPAENMPNNDIIITLGSDLIDTYKYEEATMQDLQNAENDNTSGF